MNKLKTLRAIAALCSMACALCIATSCTADETDSEQATGGTLTVSVSDGGFTHPNGTRATESGYTTTFDAGDNIGVFAVKDGNLCTLVDNVCLTLGSSGWKTTDGNGIVLVPGATYYAYYPYTASLEGEPVTTATDADGFFANVISSWTVNDDQSTYANYTASDLMVAQATVEDDALSFSMAHKMGLVVISVPKTKYVAADATLSYDYTINSTVTWSDSFAPYDMGGGIYRKIVRPDSELTVTGKYIGGTFDYTVTPSAGNAVTGKVDGGNTATVSKSYSLTVGDYYMSDGTLLPKDATLSDEQKANCIGIVFYVGKHSNDGGTYTSPTTVHGYVAALKDAASGINWYTAKSAAEAYTVNGKGAPAKTSGWFLPSLSLLQAASNNISDEQFTSVGGEALAYFKYNNTYYYYRYWSSTVGGYDSYLNLYSYMTLCRGHAYNYSYTSNSASNFKARAVLAF